MFGVCTLTQVLQLLQHCLLCTVQDMLKLEDLMRPPSLVSILPLLRRGLVLTLRNIISFGASVNSVFFCGLGLSNTSCVPSFAYEHSDLL